jgi:hypothetical protein
VTGGDILVRGRKDLNHFRPHVALTIRQRVGVGWHGQQHTLLVVPWLLLLLLLVGLLELRWVLLSMVVGLVVLLVVLVIVLLVVLMLLLLLLVVVLLLVRVLLVVVLLLVVALVPDRVVADIVVSLTIISLIMREHRKRRTTRTPVVGLAMRSWRRNYFLASVVESSETTALLRGREAARVGVGSCHRTMRRLRSAIVVAIILAIILVLASTSSFVSTSLFVTQKGCYVAVITRPTPRAKKVVATSATASPRLV